MNKKMSRKEEERLCMVSRSDTALYKRHLLGRVLTLSELEEIQLGEYVNGVLHDVRATEELMAIERGL